VSIILPKTSYLSPINGNVDMESQTFTPIQFYGNFKINDRLSAGIGVNNTFGLGTKWDDDWEGKFVSQEIELVAFFIHPTLSYKISDNVGVGAGITYATGEVLIRRAVPVTSTAAYGQAHLDGTGSGIGFNAGLFFQLNDKASAGIAYRSQLKVEVDDGTAQFTDIPTSLASNFPAETKFTTELTLPSVLSFGVGYQFTDELLIALDLNITGWTTYDSLELTFPEASSLNSSEPRKYENAIAIRLGGEYRYNDKMKFRAGFAYDQTPIQDDYVGPDLPDNDKIIVNLGLGYKVNEKLSVDLAYLWEDVMERKAENISSGFAGTYKTRLSAFAVGVNYNF
ncbi:MAG: outer membrane beta-barrel protein, partial [Bacteroidia bacterium]|nr:outer membrane beta-barrel protein [Bacteroidia bacterium]